MRHTMINAAVCLALVLLCAGCATAPLDQARRNFQAGELAQADTNLASIPRNKDAILCLMERGMIRHLRHDYENSTRDWLTAAQIEEQLETHSLTKAGASMVINDTALAFRGYPYERALLRTFTARNFLARGLWDDAAVEARNALRILENLDGFPDDAYSRYLAGLCFDLSGDADGAALQYRLAGTLAQGVRVEETTGRFLAPTNAGFAVTAPTLPSVPSGLPNELVCLVDIDGTAWGPTADYAEIVCDGRVLGISHTLAHSEQLKMASEERMAVKHLTKTVARIALKETIASVVESQNEELGELLRILLFAVEGPDTRRWETLPMRLGVARVPCPANLATFDVVFKTGYGAIVKRVTLTHPMSRKGRVFFAYCRDAP